MLYNNAIRLHYHVVFFSLEMYEKQIYQRLIVRHANNEMFRKHGQIITMTKLRSGNLSGDEKRFLDDVVIPDLMTNKTYGDITVIDSLALGSNGIKDAVDYVEKKIQSKGDPRPVHMVIIDYLQLLAQYWGEGMGIDPMTATKIMARYMKDLALTFNGHGLVVVALSQLSRAAYMAAREAVKNSREADPYQSVFGITSFAESSEIERASDLCITIFSDDNLKDRREALVQLIKNRDGDTIERGFRVLAQPDIGYIGDYKKDDGEASALNDELGKLLAEVADI
jgi:replicative DNA helicase